MDFEKYLTEAKKEQYTWDNINTALTMTGFGPRVISDVLKNINRVKKEKLTVKMMDEK